MRREDIIKEHDAKFDDYTDEKSTLVALYLNVDGPKTEDEELLLQRLQGSLLRLSLGSINLT